MASVTISPKDVSELRARTGAGMMDCKRALEEAGGDMDKAVEVLRKKAIAKADTREQGDGARTRRVGSDPCDAQRHLGVLSSGELRQ